MADSELNYYTTLAEAIDAAREAFIANNPDVDEDDLNVQQFNVQKYVLQDGDIVWQAEFFCRRRATGRVPADVQRRSSTERL